jgi:hypothetical protein
MINMIEGGFVTFLISNTYLFDVIALILIK